MTDNHKELWSSINGLKEDISGIRTDVAVVKTELTTVKGTVDDIKTIVDGRTRNTISLADMGKIAIIVATVVGALKGVGL